MIQIYDPSNKNFEMNGEVLHPERCEASFILNGVWDIELECPFNSSVVEDAVLSVPTPYGKRQLYRLYKVEKDDDYCYASGYPIFMDSKNDCFLFDVRPTDKNGQDALNIMLNGSKYSASSDIAKTSTSYFYNKNFIEALNGNEDNSFINRWGGEIAYKNFEIIVNERLGSDNGVRAEFGFNLTGINETVDMSDVVTSIIPVAFNGHMLPDNETVDSPLINNYPVARVKVFTYEDIRYIDDIDENEDVTDITVCSTLDELYDSLRTRAYSEYDNEIDKPDITYDISMVDLSKTDLYKDYTQLMNVNLGDTIHCRHKRLSIETSARVIEMTYDCILDEVIDLKLGDYIPTYFDRMTDTSAVVNKVINQETQTLIGEKISGVINLLKTSLKAQKDIAQKQDVRAILFEDLDPDSTTFGAMCIGTQGIQISKQRNETDTAWVWGTAIDFQTIYADHIITGILSDKIGNFYLDMDNGELVMRNASLSGTINANDGIIGNFEISDDGLSKKTKTVLKKIYTSDDSERIKQIIMDEVDATEEDYYYYDTNENGTITATDYLKVETFFIPANGVIYTEVIINAFPFVYDGDTINPPFITVRYLASDETTVLYESTIGGRVLNAPTVSANSVQTQSLSVNGYSVDATDDGWSHVIPNSPFIAYGSMSDPMYRRNGNRVEIRGCVQPSEVITGSADKYTIFTLPSGYRPSNMPIYQICQGSGQLKWLLSIETNGNVTFSRYNNGNEYKDTSTTSWLPFQCMFFID